VRGIRETGRLPVRQAPPGDNVTARPGGQAYRADRTAQATQTTQAAPRKTRPAWSHQSRAMVDTSVLWRPACPAGASLTGPVIVESPESTLFVPPGWQASLAADGAAVLRYGTDAAGEQR
jgi:N-methylhydantoinase A/oxoprolinase/acetone carboxylase beta subunit